MRFFGSSPTAVHFAAVSENAHRVHFRDPTTEGLYVAKVGLQHQRNRPRAWIQAGVSFLSLLQKALCGECFMRSLKFREIRLRKQACRTATSVGTLPKPSTDSTEDSPAAVTVSQALRPGKLIGVVESGGHAMSRLSGPRDLYSPLREYPFRPPSILVRGDSIIVRPD